MEKKENKKFNYQTWRKVEVWVSDDYIIEAEDKEIADRIIVELAKIDYLEEDIDWTINDDAPQKIKDISKVKIYHGLKDWGQMHWDLCDPRKNTMPNGDKMTYELYDNNDGGRGIIWDNTPIEIKREEKFKELGL
jgi:hypothetical protein